MSNNGAGTWPWNPTGSGTAGMCCWRRSPGSTKRRSGGGARSWRPRWGIVLRIGCGCRVAGVHRSKKKDATLVPALEALVAPETAGDPMSEQKWVRSSLRQLSRRLGEVGHTISHQTVGRVLQQLDYSLHGNVKRREAGEAHADRDTQFTTIAAQRQACQEAGVPVISVDTKKKELIGNFKQAG